MNYSDFIEIPSNRVSKVKPKLGLWCGDMDSMKEFKVRFLFLYLSDFFYKPDKRIQLFVVLRVKDPEKKRKIKLVGRKKRDTFVNRIIGIYVLSTPKRYQGWS